MTAAPITFTNVISGPGGFYWDSYNNLLTFTANNTYTGPSLIGNGLTLALTGNGAISHSSLIFFGGNDGTAVRLDASGRSDGTLTLANGQTLAGIGAVTGNLTVGSGAVLSPAGTNSLLQNTNLIGLVSASGNVTLGGTTIIKLNGSGTSDTVQAGGAIQYGGTLNLANVSGTPLAAGNSFHIFSAGELTRRFFHRRNRSDHSGTGPRLGHNAIGRWHNQRCHRDVPARIRWRHGFGHQLYLQRLEWSDERQLRGVHCHKSRDTVGQLGAGVDQCF